MTDEPRRPGEQTSDPYGDIPILNDAGENQAYISPEGEVTGLPRKLPEEKPNKWKGSQKIQALPDSAITQYQTRPSGVVDYRLLDGSVSYRKGKKHPWLCHKHVCNDCPCVRRVMRYREEHAA